MQVTIFTIFAIFYSVFGSPRRTPNCPNQNLISDAQQCSQRLWSYSDQLDDVDDDDVLLPRTIRLMTDYCGAFRSCSTSIQQCNLYTQNTAQVMENACNFYDFTGLNNDCQQRLGMANSRAIDCLGDIVDSIVDEDEHNSKRCFTMRQKMQCAVFEIQSVCSQSAANEYQRYFKGQMQQWRC